MMRVSIVGSGYVGLVTGACLAERGHEVVCVDLDARRVRSINEGVPPIHERGLEPLLRRHAGKRLRAVTDLETAVRETDITLIAVGTPFDGEAIDLAQIRGAAAGIGKALAKKDPWHMVVVKSTVVPGTTENVVLPLLERESGKASGTGFGVGMNPEFLTEGEAVEDFMYPDRLVLGAIDDRSLDAMEALYESFPDVERIRVNCRTAEMIKYASNSLLATLISFSNEIANLCSSLGGVDAMDVVKGVQASKYLSLKGGQGESGIAPIADFLVPGCGFGGSCLPKDISALIAHGKSAGTSMRLLEAVRDTNLGQPAYVARLLQKRIHDLKGAPITVLGLAFRPGTSDMRESPAIPIIRDLLARGARISAYDPALVPAVARSPEAVLAMAAASNDPAAGFSLSAWEGAEGAGDALREESDADRASALFEGRVHLCHTLEEAVAGARGIVVLTRWHEFHQLPAMIDALDTRDPPIIVDGRRMLDKSQFRAYEGIGL